MAPPTVNLATGTDVMSRLGRIENMHDALVEQTDRARRELMARIERLEETLYGQPAESNPYPPTENLLIGEAPKTTVPEAR